MKNRKRFVLEVVNARLSMSATELEIRRLHAAHAPVGVVLGDKANGPAVVERLKKNLTAVIAVNPQGGKLSRLVAVSPEFEAGDWYVSRNAPWSGSFVDQITNFPSAPNDDMCDAMSQAAIWLANRPQATPFLIPNMEEPSPEELIGPSDAWRAAHAKEIDRL